MKTVAEGEKEIFNLERVGKEEQEI